MLAWAYIPQTDIWVSSAPSFRCAPLGHLCCWRLLQLSLLVLSTRWNTAVQSNALYQNLLYSSLRMGCAFASSAWHADCHHEYWSA